MKNLRCNTINIVYHNVANKMSNNIVSKPSTKRIVWQHFGLLKGPNGNPVDDGKGVYNKTPSAKNRNTSNLLAHFQTTHPTDYAWGMDVMAGKSTSYPLDKQVDKQLTITKSIRSMRKRGRNGRSWQVPLILSSKGDVSHIHGREVWLQKDASMFWYKVPSRHYFSKIAIPVLYDLVRDQEKVGLVKQSPAFLIYHRPMAKHWDVLLHKLYCPQWVEAA